MAYHSMILAFTNANRIKDAEQVFDAYLQACRTGKIREYPITMTEEERRAQIMVWNLMIEAYFRVGQPDKAVGLVDQMLQSTAGDKFMPKDVPIATSSTFTTVIAGFLLSGDLQSALNWFNNLLGQERTPSNPFEGLGGRAMRPDSVAWHLIIDALAAEGNLEELNRLYMVMKANREEDNLMIRPVDRMIIHRANMDNLKNLNNEAALQTLQFLLDDLAELEPSQEKWNMQIDICNEFVARGQYELPATVIVNEVVRELQAHGDELHAHTLLWLQKVALDFSERVYGAAAEGKGDVPFFTVLDLGRLGFRLGLKQELKFSPFILHSYGYARSMSLLPYDELLPEDWNIFLSHAVHFEDNALRGNPNDLHIMPTFSFHGLGSLLEDMATHGFQFDQVHPETRNMVIQVLGANLGEQGRRELFEQLGASYTASLAEFEQAQAAVLEDSLSASSPTISLQTETTQTSVDTLPELAFDRYHSRAVYR